MKPRHIVLDCRMADNTGVGQVIRNLVCRLPRLSGFSYTIVVNPGTKLDVDQASCRLVTLSRPIPIYSIREQLLLPRVLKGLKPDLVHFMNFNMPLFYRGRCVVTVHDISYYRFREACPHYLGHLYARFMITHAVRRARRVITDSQFSKRELVSVVGAREEKIRVVYCGVDPKLFYPLEVNWSRERLLARYGIGEPYIFYVGNHEPRKNLVRLIQAFCLSESHRRHLLVIGGRQDGRRRKLYQEAERLGVQGRVRFIGEVPQEDLPVFYSGASLLAFPSLYEGFGLPPLEAMACGACVLTSGEASLPEVAGDAAFYIDPFSPSSIAEGLDRLIKDERLNQEISARGLRRVRSVLWETTVEETLSVYRDVLEG